MKRFSDFVHIRESKDTILSTHYLNRPEYRFSLTQVFFIQENTSQRKPVFWYILGSGILACFTQCGINCDYVTFSFVCKAPANNLTDLLKVAVENRKQFLILVGDCDPDMNSVSYINTFCGRIWQNLNLTKLTCITYQAG